MNGAGCVKTFEDFARMVRSASSAVVLGSITKELRLGNAGTTYVRGYEHSVNALGLPNPGAAYYMERLPAMIELAEANHKPLIVSLAGFNIHEWVWLIQMCESFKPHGIELNFGCPNVREEAPIWSFDPEAMRDVMTSALTFCGVHADGVAVGVKLSPFSDPDDLLAVAAAIPHGIEYVVASNTFPNVPAHGLSVPYGGMSGRGLQPIALGQVQQLRDLLDPSVAVVGAGGVSNRADIARFLDVGAAAVQATTAYYEAGENPMVFSDILSR